MALLPRQLKQEKGATRQGMKDIDNGEASSTTRDGDGDGETPMTPLAQNRH